MNERELARLLPGRWQIQATNFPMWLSGKRTNPTITYGVLATEPLTLTDLVEYQNKRGKMKSIAGVDTVNQNGFEWRGEGILQLLKSQWRVVTVTEELLIIRFEASLLTSAGMDILLREGIELLDLRKKLADSLEQLDLSMDEFQSLSWLK